MAPIDRHTFLMGPGAGAGFADLVGAPEEVTVAATLVRDARIEHPCAGGLPS
ncbi:MAG TPA: hypothetical protein VIN04_11865 [Myxococcota bacterium]